MNDFLHDRSRLALRRSLNSSQADRLVDLFKQSDGQRGASKQMSKKSCILGAPYSRS